MLRNHIGEKPLVIELVLRFRWRRLRLDLFGQESFKLGAELSMECVAGLAFDFDRDSNLLHPIPERHSGMPFRRLRTLNILGRTSTDRRDFWLHRAKASIVGGFWCKLERLGFRR